jgi:tetratricopeptide (TPR) repeat protein
LNCSEIEREEMLEKYVTGKLPEAEQEELEEHLLACEDCRQRLGELSLLTVSLESDQRAVEIERTETRRFWHWGWVAAAAVIILGIFLWPLLSDRSADRDDLIASLSAVEAPPYELKVARGGAQEAEIRFRAAMVHYQDGQYEETIPGLQSASELDPDSAQIHFFLGASYLLEAQPERAIDSLSRVVASDDVDFMEWAHFYRAKASLQLGDLDLARKDLTEVVEIGGDLQADARGILDQLPP